MSRRNELREKQWERRAEKAETHIEDMLYKYPAEILASIEESIIYGNPDIEPEWVAGNGSKKTVAKMDIVSAIFAFSKKGKRLAVLNFADYKVPGGLFLKGSGAQEESLCHESTLYNVISNERFTDYYAFNKANLNQGLYMDRAIYSPGIVFERKENVATADVITCAAPNASVAVRKRFLSNNDNWAALNNRIVFIRNIAEEQKVDRLILGAFGCGVFGQNPTEVSIVCDEAFRDSSVKEVIYAIPDDNNRYAFLESYRRKMLRTD